MNINFLNKQLELRNRLELYIHSVFHMAISIIKIQTLLIYLSFHQKILVISELSYYKFFIRSGNNRKFFKKQLKLFKLIK